MTTLPRLREHALPLAALAGLAAAVLAPSWRPGAVVGAVDTDVWPHVWGYWWIGRSILAGEGVPLHTELLKYPMGGSLYFPDLAGALLSVPLQAVVSLEAACDAVLGIKLWLIGAGGYALVRATGVGRSAGLVAGVVLLVHPYFLAEMHDGIGENLSFGWAALTAAALVALGRARGWLAALALGALAGVLFAITFLGSWYYALGAAAFGGLWLLARAWTPGERGPRVWAGLAAAVALAAALVHPQVVAVERTLAAEQAIVGRSAQGVAELFDSGHNAVDPLTLVLPGDYRSPDLAAQYGENFVHVSYLGWLLLLSAVAGGALRRDRAALLWGLGAAGFLTLTLGPYLYVAGDYVRFDDGARLRLPFAWVVEHVPFFDRAGHPQRFTPFLVLCLLPLAAATWDRWLGGEEGDAPRAVAPGAGIGLAAIAVVEAVLISPAPFPIAHARLDVDPFLTELGSTDGGAVIDLPARFQPRYLNTRYFYLQTAHGRPIVHTINGPFSTLHLDLADNPFVGELVDVEFPDDAAGPSRDPARVRAGVARLREQGFEYVLVHPPYVTDPAVAAQLETTLEHHLGEPTYRSEALVAFELVAREPQPASPGPADAPSP